MDKVLVTLIVPSVEEKFNVWIPDFIKISEVVILLSEAISDLTQNMYRSSGHEVLCRSNPNMILDTECTMSDYGVAHGECLYLL